MSLVTVSNLTKYYGAIPVLTDINFRLEYNEHVGLIGRNGSGKTTLMSVLAGTLEYDAGDIIYAKGVKVGYLTQEFSCPPNKTVYEICREVFVRFDKMKEKLRQLELKISESSGGELDKILREYGELQEKFEREGGFLIESQTQGVLRGLGFSPDSWSKKVACLSGGEKSRLALGLQLLKRPDLLLLDEPTNYLDLTALRWLEQFLSGYSGAHLVISHDRYFLDQVVTRTLALENGKIRSYRGNYSFYRRVVEEERRHLEKAYRSFHKKMAEKEKFIREAKASEKRQAKSVQKRLTKEEQLQPPPREEPVVSPNFINRGRAAKIILDVQNLSKAVGGIRLLKNICLRVTNGEKVAIMGANGTGKTTLLRVLTGELLPDEGEINWGHGVNFHYFPQILSLTEVAGTPLDQMTGYEGFTDEEARKILGRFGFSGDKVNIPVKELSGGEQRRLIMARITATPVNVHIMDEPTNHLDTATREALEEALMEFGGTLIFVSHDRYFVEKLADRILVLEDGSLTEYPDYETYRALKDNDRLKPEKEEREQPAKRTDKKKKKAPSEGELRKKKRLIEEAEENINRLEEEIADIKRRLTLPEVFNDFIEAQKLGDRLEKLECELDRRLTEWSNLAEELTELSDC